MNYRTRGVQANGTIGAPGRDARTFFGTVFACFARPRTPGSLQTLDAWDYGPPKIQSALCPERIWSKEGRRFNSGNNRIAQFPKGLLNHRPLRSARDG